MKTCSKCCIEKPRSEFAKRKASLDGLQPSCKACKKSEYANWYASNSDVSKKASVSWATKNHKRVRANTVKWRSENSERVKRNMDAWRKANPEKAKSHRLKNKFSITLEYFNELLEAQNYRCKICNTDVPRGRGNFHIDHDHLTGKVRGLLCNCCNVGLGMFKDDEEILLKAAAYLSKST